MAVFYLDTYAMVKRYHRESGSEVVDRVFEAGFAKHGLATSFWTVLEFMVAFSAKRRRKEISTQAFNAAVARFLKDLTDLVSIGTVNDELVASSISIATKYALPSADCLQLSAAIDLRKALEEEGQRLVLISSDEDMCKVAGKEGLEYINPEEKGTEDTLGRILG